MTIEQELDNPYNNYLLSLARPPDCHANERHKKNISFQASRPLHEVVTSLAKKKGWTTSQVARFLTASAAKRYLDEQKEANQNG